MKAIHRTIKPPPGRIRGWRAVSRLTAIGALAALLAACATPPPKPTAQPAPKAVEQAQKAEQAAPPARKILKRKIAVGRFTNETLYGRALLTGAQLDAMGRQVGDILAARLIETGKFIVLERPDLGAIQAERALSGAKSGLVGANTLIVGSLTEFGRSTEGQDGFLSNTKKQVARAKVDLRLVKPETGHAFFSASGTGQAATQSGSVMGFGGKAAYDQTLNDRAISAAIADLMNALVNKLEEQPWQSDILEIEGGQVFVSGGTAQGLAPGQRLLVMRRGKTVVSGQTGFPIELPPTRVAEIEIVSTFGTDPTNEGSVARIVSGAVSKRDRNTLFVAEKP